MIYVFPSLRISLITNLHYIGWNLVLARFIIHPNRLIIDPITLITLISLHFTLTIFLPGLLFRSLTITLTWFLAVYYLY